MGIIFVVALVFISFNAYEWITSNNDENQQYSQETQEELEKFRNEVMERIGKKEKDRNPEKDKVAESPEKEEISSEENNTENNPVVSQRIDEPDDSIEVSEKYMPQKEPKTMDEVAPSYEQVFNELEDKANQLLENLISQAKKEYDSLTMKEKENPVVLSAMASDYLAKSKTLERQIDEVFYDVLGDMKEELKTNQLDTGILKQFEKEYVDNKRERKKELMEKALEVDQ